MQKILKRVGTHHGRFHADEVMATAILKELFDLEVVRTRDMDVLNSLDLVYDVGGGEFDHHDVEKEHRENGIPYAACGLIWRRFGREVIQLWEPSLDTEDIDSTFHHVDAALIQGIDAVDNGYKVGREAIRTMSVSSIISGFNPPWYSEGPEDSAFHQAVELASSIFWNVLTQRLAVIRARSIVKKGYEGRPRPELLILEVYCPWGEMLQEIDTEEEILFVIYPNRGAYVIQTIRKKDGTWDPRKPLPKAWAGKRDEELGKITGLEDAVFCHPARFIAGAGSMESIMKMAEMAIEEPPEKGLKRFFWRVRIWLPGRRNRCKPANRR